MNTMGKDGLTLVTELINRSNSLQLKVGDFTISEVRPVDGQGYNTQAALVGAQGWLGQTTVQYNRIDLTTIFAGLQPTLDITSEMTGIYDLLDIIAARYGIALDEETVENTVINRDDPDSATVYLRFKVEHPAYLISDVQGLLFREITRDIPLSKIIQNRSLPGLVYPDGNVDKGQASIYSYDWDGTIYKRRLVSYQTGDSADSLLLEIVNEVNSEVDPDRQRVWVLNPSQTVDYNLGGGIVSYNGPTGTVPSYNPNTDYAKVLVIGLGSRCKNFAGHLLIHYN